MILAVGYYDAMNSQSHVVLFAILISIACGMVAASFSALLSCQFPVMVRYTGIAFSYNVSFAIFGGLTPVIATSLVLDHDQWLGPAWIMVGIGLLGLIGIVGRWKSFVH